MMNGEHLDLICNGDGDLSTFGQHVILKLLGYYTK